MRTWMFALGACVLRLLTAFLSARNEKRLKQTGAREYGAGNSREMSMLHTMYYAGCLVEALTRDVRSGLLAALGILLYTFSMLILWLVIRQLGALWTIKLIVAEGHTLNRSPLFQYVRHPNYLLNILPELLSLALIARAWITLCVLALPYLFVLCVRIVQEEAVMKQAFPEEWTGYCLLQALPRSFVDWASRGCAEPRPNPH